MEQTQLEMEQIHMARYKELVSNGTNLASNGTDLETQKVANRPSP